MIKRYQNILFLMRLAIWWIKLDQNQVSTKLLALSPQIEFSQHAMSAKKNPIPYHETLWVLDFFVREGISPNRIHPQGRPPQAAVEDFWTSFTHQAGKSNDKKPAKFECQTIHLWLADSESYAAMAWLGWLFLHSIQLKIYGFVWKWATPNRWIISFSIFSY